jgi:hypothetical protein
MMVPMILGKLYLPLSLREGEENIGGHKKKSIRRQLEKKIAHLPQYDSFRG